MHLAAGTGIDEYEKTQRLDDAFSKPIDLEDITPANPALGSARIDTLRPLTQESLQQLVSNRFQIERVLGAGGMGQVYLATDIRLKRKVAIKSILPELSANPEWVARLHAEARIIARLQHPNIVQIYEILEINHHSLLVMEYVEGLTLQQMIRQQRLSQQELLCYLQQASEAVGYAHAHGVIHHDIKPGNIMIGTDGQAKIMDFGIAGLEDDGANTPVEGSPAYMAPEKFLHHDQGDTRSDVYALGVSLYYGITGRQPFHDRDPGQMIHKITQAPVTLPSQINPAIHPDLEAICIKAMQRNPDRRYATATRLADDLARFSHGRPVKACHYLLKTQLRRSISRFPKAFAAMLATALLLFAGIFFSADHIHNISEQAILNELDHKIRAQANTISILLPKAPIRQLALQPDAQQQPDDIREAVLQIKAFEQDIRDVYLVLPTQASNGFYTAMAWHGSEEDEHEGPGVVHGHDTWGDSITIKNPNAIKHLRGAMNGHISTQQEYDSEGDNDEWTQRLLGYAPIHDERGNAFAVIVIEVASQAVADAFEVIEEAFVITVTLAGILSVTLMLIALGGLVLLWRLD